MEQPTSPVRLTRGLILCTVGVLPAVGAHVVAGGSAPSPLLLAVVLLGLTAAASTASAREWSTPRLVLALAISQIAVHATLWLTGTHAMHSAPRASVVPTTGAGVLNGGVDMIVWHALAVALSAALLRHGERLVHLFARLVRSALGALPVVEPIIGTPRRMPTSVPRLDVRPRLLLLGAADRRGPPAFAPAL